MRNVLAAFLWRTFSMLVCSAAFTSAATALAQSAPPTGPSDSELARARARADREMEWREWQLRNIGNIKKVDIGVAQPQISLGKVKEDYVGIQQSNNNILTMLSARGEMDYKVVGDAAKDIKKRAIRLKSYMVTLEIAKDTERKRELDEIEPAEMKPALLTLDAAIVSLIRSPVFKEFGKVVDLNSSAKALHDLDNIIALSERIRRSVERSLKSTRASR